MSDKIKILPDPLKSIQGPVTEDQLKEATLSHISDVKHGMDLIARKIRDASLHHDFTKTEFIRDFLKDINTCRKTNQWPTDKDSWFSKYHLMERHHLEDRVPEDVNLIDVIEMIVDGVVAATARKGEGSYQERGINPDVLAKAYSNTVKLILDSVELKKVKAAPATPAEGQPDQADATQQAQATEGFTFRL